MKINDFFTPEGRANSAKLKESWLERWAPDFKLAVDLYIESNSIVASRLVEKLWYYFNQVPKTVRCANSECQNGPAFLSLREGYLEFCSLKCSNSSPEVKARKEQASLAKFGVKNPYQSQDIKEKIRQTNRLKYGVDNPMQSDQLKQGMIQKSIEKNGKPWALSSGGKADLEKKRRAKQRFEQKHADLELIVYSEEKFGECTFHQSSCRHFFVINKWQAHLRKINGNQMCTVCNPIGSFNSTIWQQEIADFLTSIGVKFVERDRKEIAPMELDFMLPDHGVAIELDGLYWHSLEFKHPNYHLEKTEMCERKNIRLIHIFEDEWLARREIVKSRLKSLLKRTSSRVFARKCEVRPISGKEASSFLDQNHIQGSIPAAVRLGLFLGDELVSVMAFGALRRALGQQPADGEYEMYRFCTKLDLSVVGAAGKLLNSFISQFKPSSIISYADRRWSTGDLYKQLGFDFVSTTRPNVWYVKGARREHRFNYTRQKVLKIIGSQSTEPTDSLIDQLGVDRIYDCGNLKFEMKIK